MSKLWQKPIYTLKTKDGKKVLIDVTSSANLGLPPNAAISSLIDYLKSKSVERIVDFGAGALRHCFPLLEAGFQICAVEFEEQFKKETCAKALTQAKQNPNFSTLIWPRDFKDDDRKFDAALLCYVLQTMPIESERKQVLKLLYKKLKQDSYLLYMSRFNQSDGIVPKHKVEDGYFKWPDREYHSFYREFNTEETHKMFSDYKFKYIKYLSQRGTDQIFLYGKGDVKWV